MISPHDLFIDGQWRPAADGRRFAVHDPADGSELARFAAATEADCLAAVDAAADALAGWAATPPRQRSEILRALLRHPDRRARAVRRDHRRRERQGVRRRARRGHLRGRVLPLVRRGGGPDRRRLPALPVGRQDDRGPARSDRGVGPDHAVELPGGDGDPQDRPRAGGRVFGGAEAGQPDSAHGRLRRRGTPAGRCAGRGRQPGDAGARRSGGERDAAPSRRTQAVLHRLDRGRTRAAARRPPTRWSARRWSSAGTRRSSSCPAPTWTPRSRARWSRRCATADRPVRRPTGSTCTTRSSRSSPPGSPRR